MFNAESLSTMSDPLPIIADTPCRDARLGFEAYAEAIADAIRGGLPAQFTVGIYGPWGCGKTSLLNSILGNLEKDDRVIPVMFDAWRYEGSGPIVVPLLHKIAETSSQLTDSKVNEQLKRALAALVYSLSFSIGGLGLDMKKMHESLQPEELTSLDIAFARPFQELSKLASVLGGRRIVVLIDDLDRCSSENVVSMLETINVVMDIPGVIFVLALDYDVLIKAIIRKYPDVSGHNFLEKMVQVPFRVPRLRLRADSFLYELIPDWPERTADLPASFGPVAFQISTMALNANPRQIKRFVNSVLILSRIVKARRLVVNHSLLASVVGLQLRWPDQYEAFTENVYRITESETVLADKESPLEPLKGKDQSLDTYIDLMMLPHRPKREELAALLELTQVIVASSEAASGIQEAIPNPGIWLS